MNKKYSSKALQSRNKNNYKKNICNEVKEISQFSNKGLNKKISTINLEKGKDFRISSLKNDSCKIVKFFQRKIKEGYKNYLSKKREIDTLIKQGELNDCLQRHESVYSKLKLPKINANLMLNKDKFKFRFFERRKNNNLNSLIRNQSMPSILEDSSLILDFKNAQPFIIMQNIEQLKVQVNQHESINRISKMK